MQPNPTPNDRAPIADLVMQDMRDRKDFGIQQYGTPLQAFNGRDSLQDAYEEALDLTVYIKQWMEEKQVLLHWLTRLFEAYDERDPRATSEAIERLKVLSQSINKNGNANDETTKKENKTP